MHEIHVSIMSAEAAENGVAELWAAGDLIGYTILDDSDLMLRIEPRHDHAAVTVGARSLAEALGRAEQLLETYPHAAPGGSNWPERSRADADSTLRSIPLEG
ncbi:MAG TPA: hypothetical protein VFW09_11345 [Solirubrobacteraceae bacterium]|nr:hypothetical protein [Solirubrobacteraceae bacterium]